MATRPFLIDEGALQVPAHWQDQTLNVLVDKTTGPGFSLSISRDRLPWGMSFDAYAAREFGKVTSTFSECEELARAEVQVGGAAARLMEFRWKANIGPVHQILVIVAHGEEKALIFAGSNPGEMNVEQKRQFLALVQTFSFSSPRA